MVTSAFKTANSQSHSLVSLDFNVEVNFRGDCCNTISKLWMKMPKINRIYHDDYINLFEEENSVLTKKYCTLQNERVGVPTHT